MDRAPPADENPGTVSGRPDPQVALLEAFMEQLGVNAWVKNADGRYLMANRGSQKQFSPTRSMLGLTDLQLFGAEVAEVLQAHDQHVAGTGEPLSTVEEVPVGSGDVRCWYSVKFPVQVGAELHVGGVAVDITTYTNLERETKRLELELRQAQKLESVGRLASGIAHEINTPIQFVGDQNRFTADAVGDLMALVRRYRAFADRVAGSGTFVAERAALQRADEEADLPYLEEALPRAFTAITEGVSRVARLVAAMKEFGHPDRGVPVTADLNRALATTIIIAANELKHVADVKTDFADLPPVRCLIGDLNQVFLNLLVNAAHAISDAGRAAQGIITVSTRLQGDTVEVCITDNGTGIPEEARRKIFEPFFTTKEVGRGTGQGLAIARMLVVDKHHGALTFDTELGRGTTFHVRIPVDGPPLSPV